MQINRFVMSIVFFIPLTIIALYEASMNNRGPKFVRSWIHRMEATDQDQAERHADPEADEDGLRITKVRFMS